MKVHLIADKKREVPESWDEVTLDQFVEAYAEVKKEDQTGRDKMRFVLDLFGVTYKEFCRMDTDDQIALMETTRFALETLPEDGEENGFEFEGKRYQVPANWGEVSVAEWIDLDHYLKTLGPIRGIPFFLAIYFRPVDRTEYDSDEAEALAEKFKGMPVPAAWRAANFFTRRAQSLLRMSIACSKVVEVAERETERARLSVKNGAGLGFFARWRARILLRWIEF